MDNQAIIAKSRQLGMTPLRPTTPEEMQRLMDMSVNASNSTETPIFRGFTGILAPDSDSFWWMCDGNPDLNPNIKGKQGINPQDSLKTRVLNG